MPPSHRVVTRALAAMTAGVAIAACGAAAVPDPAATVDEILAARHVVRPPAEALATATVAVATATTQARLGDPPEPSARADLLAAVERDALPALRDATAAIEAVSLAGDTPHVAAAREALAEAGTAARALDAAATADITHVRRLLAFDDALGAIAAAWDERGSRLEQIDRFSALEADARAIGTEVATVAERPACSTAVARRAAAAEAVALASAELRGLIEGYEGERFDARRAELAADPYGTGHPLGESDADDAACWASSAEAPANAAAVEAALDALEAALTTPDDAATPRGSPG